MLRGVTAPKWGQLQYPIRTQRLPACWYTNHILQRASPLSAGTHIERFLSPHMCAVCRCPPAWETLPEDLQCVYGSCPYTGVTPGLHDARHHGQVQIKPSHQPTAGPEHPDVPLPLLLTIEAAKTTILPRFHDNSNRGTSAVHVQ